MILSPAQQRQYPNLTRYLQNDIQNVGNVRRVQRAAAEYGQLNTARLQQALTWGRMPLITIAPLDHHGGFTAGSFDAERNPNEIRINTSLAEAFERRQPESMLWIRDLQGRRHYRIKVSILHEMIHWGDAIDGNDYDSEEGVWFEIAVYGYDTPG
jgi:hypothetical protein